MAPTTTAEWLPILAKRLDARMPRIVLNRRYSNGDAPMPEMGKNTRSSWEAFQKRARTNYGGLTCESLAGRMIALGARVGDSASPEALEVRRIWRNNRLDVVFADAIDNMLSTSVGYLVAGVRAGDAVITSELPEQMITAPDPVQSWRALAALKAWRDEEDGNDYAYVWITGERQKFYRSATNDSGTPIGSIAGGWQKLGDPELFDGDVPVFVLDNKSGVAEFEPNTDVIDRINLGKLQRLVITAMQAYKQRAIKGGLPAKDAEGNDIDWAAVFEAAPGAIWDLPEGVDIWESSAIDITSILKGEDTDARDFSAVQRTPLSVFLPDGQNQSAEGAANAKEGEIQKAKDRTARASAPMEASLVAALRIRGFEPPSVEMLWQPPEHVSFTEKTQAATQARAAGVSSRWVKQNIMGMSPEEIDQDEEDLAAEQLLAFSAAGGAGGDA